MNVPVQSLYVHIPFCASKCFYCDFNSYVSSEAVMERYVDALCKEFQMIENAYTYEPLKTIFFGGGTPTMLSPRLLEQVLRSLRDTFAIDPNVELTFEANPGSVNRDKLSIMRDLGVNRLSFGVQSFDDTMLHSLGRLHDTDTVYKSWNLARLAGFDSVNLDLMIGLPGQSVKLLEDSLRQLVSIGPEHVSVYGLKIEQGTPFAKWYDQGHLQLPPEEDDVAMYETVQETLGSYGYAQYEISNFAKPGHESRHNQVYWRNEPYLAAGAGAHGYAAGDRYANIRRLEPYMEAVEAYARPIEESFSISAEEEQEDTMMLGLRLAEGVSFDRFEKRHQRSMLEVFGDEINVYVDKQLLVRDSMGVHLPKTAYIVGNEVFAGFIRTNS